MRQEQIQNHSAETLKSIDEAIDVLVTLIRGYQEQIAALSHQIENAKAELRPLLEERGENWSDEDGFARLVSPGERISYDTKGLDTLLIEDPLRYGWLKDYRTKTPVRGGLQVK